MANTEITRFDGVQAGIWEPTGQLDRIGQVRALLADWLRRHRYRADLKRLLKVGPHMIADIGLTLEAAKLESEKPFWQP